MNWNLNFSRPTRRTPRENWGVLVIIVTMLLVFAVVRLLYGVNAGVFAGVAVGAVGIIGFVCYYVASRLRARQEPPR